jgi:hypothetical protein
VEPPTAERCLTSSAAALTIPISPEPLHQQQGLQTHEHARWHMYSKIQTTGTHQWVKNLSDFSTSMLGTLKAMTSYGAAWKHRYCMAFVLLLRQQSCVC